MPSTEKTVLIERIRLEDKTFQITTEASIGKLAASIARLGVMHSPILLSADSGYEVVCGFRRIAACKSLGVSEISARLLSPEMDKSTCVQLAIAENSLQRPLNLIETSRALVLLSGVYPDPDALCQAAGVLGLPDNYAAIRKLRQLSGLAPEIQEGVLSNILSMAMALELGQMEKSSGIGLSTLFGCLKLGLNKQREVLTMIQEIAFREHLTVKDILNAPELHQIMVHEKWDRSQKTLHLRQYLRRRRYPSITSVESDFEARVRSLDLVSGIALIPPRDFEGTTFSFHLNFNNLDELQYRLSRLTEVSSSHIMNNILNGCRISIQ
ncbi:MAG: ParB/RepB/Spo0J family partition protein [Deltaproteobacteria bacterium]|nr:ParB/RepB/Spo0J family partition protein [Deltaproteobacteria bacterium]